MADQKLVAINHVSFLVERLSYLTQQIRNCQTKSILWYILTTFFLKHSYFALSVDIFKNICQKLKSKCL